MSSDALGARSVNLSNGQPALAVLDKVDVDAGNVVDDLVANLENLNIYGDMF